MSSRCGFANARGTLDGVRRYARLAAMQLSDESVGRFIEVYKKEYGESAKPDRDVLPQTPWPKADL